MPPDRYRPLSTKEKLLLIHFLRSLVPVARDRTHPFRRLARAQISTSLWRWTADAYCVRSNAIKQDARKYDDKRLPVTPAARELRKTTVSGLRHEHVVPRIMIADRIIENDLRVSDIYRLLSRYCHAVIVTRAEDTMLSKRSMPAGWSWESGCPFGRYREAGLYDSLIWPDSTANPLFRIRP